MPRFDSTIVGKTLERRPLEMPVGGLLVGVAGGEDTGLVEGAADDLEADRHAVARHAARQGERRDGRSCRRARCSAAAPPWSGDRGPPPSAPRSERRGPPITGISSRSSEASSLLELARERGARELQLRELDAGQRCGRASIRLASTGPYSPARDGIGRLVRQRRIRRRTAAPSRSAPRRSRPAARRRPIVGAGLLQRRRSRRRGRAASRRRAREVDRHADALALHAARRSIAA